MWNTVRSTKLLVAVALAVLLNLVPWYWGDDHTVHRAIGFPLPFYGRILGYVYREIRDPGALIVDGLFAAALYWCVDQLVTWGPRRCWRKLRTYGTSLDADV